MLVLVSSESRRRQWLNFEAGYGGGARAEIIPVTLEDFPFTKLEFPLAGYQGRPIDDIINIIADVTRKTGIAAEPVETEAYVKEIREAKATLKYKSLRVTPFIVEHLLQFEIENTGNTDLELLMLEAYVPSQYLSPHWSRGKLQHDSRTTKNGLDCHCIASHQIGEPCVLLSPKTL